MKRGVALLTLIGILMIAGPVASETIVRVGTWKTAQTIQPFFYEQFLDERTRCRVFAFTNPADQKTALLAGGLDMCGTTLAHAIHSAAIGQPVVIVAALCNKCSALVVKKDGGIQAIADLHGKKIGYVPGTMHEILLREALTRNRLSPETDVKLIRVDFFDMGLALAKGNIDAFLSGEPFPSLAVEQGFGHVLAYPYYGDTIGAINAGMLVTRGAIEQTPELVRRLVNAHVQATRYLNAHQEQWLKKASGFGTLLPVLQKAAGNMELSWYMDAAFVDRVRALGARMQALGVIRKQPDYQQLFDLRFVQQIQKELGGK
jgi:NitT/TauT family transport system substrate-binding protein